MFDAVTAHIDFIHGDDVLWKIVFDGFIHTEFPLHDIFICQQISNLNIQFLLLPAAHKVNLFFTDFSDCNTVTSFFLPFRARAPAGCRAFRCNSQPPAPPPRQSCRFALRHLSVGSSFPLQSLAPSPASAVFSNPLPETGTKVAIKSRKILR